MSFRLTINTNSNAVPVFPPAVTSAPQPTPAPAVNVTPTIHPVTIPITTPAPIVNNISPTVVPLTPLDPAVVQKEWLAKYWPKLIDFKMNVPPKINSIITEGYKPTDQAIEPWALLAARGYNEVWMASGKGTTGFGPNRLKGMYGPPIGPLEQFSSRVVQARGPSDPEAKAAIAALVAYCYPADYMTVWTVFNQLNWSKTINDMAR